MIRQIRVTPADEVPGNRPYATAARHSLRSAGVRAGILLLFLLVSGCTHTAPIPATPPRPAYGLTVRRGPAQPAIDFDVTARPAGTALLARLQDDAIVVGTTRLALRGGTHVLLADLDGDGHPDVIATTRSDLAVWRDVDTATPQSVPSPLHGVAAPKPRDDNAGPVASPSTETPARALARDTIAIGTADFDRDGHADLFLLDESPNAPRRVRILRGRGDGTFDAGAEVEAPGVHDVAVADANGDGIPDLWFLQDGPPELVIHFGNGDGTFGLTSDLRVPKARSLALGDMNGDGELDVVTGSVCVLCNSGPLMWSQTWAEAIGDGQGQAVLADLDGDGLMDVAVNTPRGLWLLRGNGNGTLQTTAPIPFAGGGRIRALDMNQDGRPDLLALGRDGLTIFMHR